MSRYSKIWPQIWTGASGRDLRALGTICLLVAVYLVTCASANALGIFYLPMPLISHELGLSLETVRNALKSIEGVGFAHYDEIESIAWVPNMARFQVGETIVPADNKWKAIVAEARQMAKSRFFPAFWEHYHLVYQLPPFDAFLPREAPSKPLQSPQEVPSEGLRSQYQYQSQNQSHEQLPGPGQSHGAGLAVAGLVPGSAKIGFLPGDKDGSWSSAEKGDDCDFGDRSQFPPESPASLTPPPQLLMTGSSTNPGEQVRDGWVEQQEKTPSGPAERIPAEVQAIYDQWDSKCTPDKPFKKVPANLKSKLIQKVLHCLACEGWRDTFIRFTEHMGDSLFYSGKVPSNVPGKPPFTAFFQWAVEKGPTTINARVDQVVEEAQQVRAANAIQPQIQRSAGRTHLRTAGDLAYLEAKSAKAKTAQPQAMPIVSEPSIPTHLNDAHEPGGRIS